MRTLVAMVPVLAFGLALAACAALDPKEPDYAAACRARGVTPGTDDFVHCVEQQRTLHQMELQRIRQTRESGRSPRL